ncbi:uncharacterized protein BDR25DRAFT_304186 [Lindgomyces ingoldianus]|uniref:Uncharacterized protein n=1 Tax=Lindgomyces ingoldianus TaxID=673940 RepID=A0ACB6QS45_9PLEO|nr:uncharacterized protein BDR25DRAFT_304186 [Lindgomyces ingoldianus]KAF2469721.1 hypothetical protein BDR25DRAFT_304186 [Lindgomyces ingoldianus]
MFRELVSASVVLLANGPFPAAASTHSDLRLNHIQVIGTHNSYHREINLAERTIFEKFVPSPQNYYYSHSMLSDQLQYQFVRSLELDLHSDEKGGLYYPPLIWTLSNLTDEQRPFNGEVLKKPGIKVFHVTDFDPNAVCHTFIDCLKNLKTWSDANPTHVPILIDLELKTDADACIIGGVCAEEAKNWTLSRLLNIDQEIRSVLPAKQLLTPDDVRQKGLTLEQSVLQHGWPRLDDVRGKFMFYFDNDPKANITTDPRNLYTANGHESLQNRTIFTNALEGSPDCAFIKHNQPVGADLVEIQRLVKKGYIVRTRADEPISTVLAKNTTMRDSAFKSGAQIVSTDFPVYRLAARWDWDYVTQLEGVKVARCNPVTAPGWCRDGILE